MKSNHNILHKLIDECLKHGLHFMSVSAYNGKYAVFAHDLKLAGRKPLVEEMRDNTDYFLAMDAWRRRGVVFLGGDTSPYGAINFAIDYLEKLGN